MNRVYGGLMRVKRYPVNSIPFFVLFFFYQASLTTAGLAASRSGAGGIGLAITTTSYDIRFVAHVSQPQERVGENGKIKKKKRKKTAPLLSVEDNQTTIRKIGSEPDQIEMSEWQGGPVVKVGAGGGWRATRGRAMQRQNPAWRGIYLPTLVARKTGGSPMQMHGMGGKREKMQRREKKQEEQGRHSQHQHQRALGLETHTRTHTHTQPYIQYAACQRVRHRLIVLPASVKSQEQQQQQHPIG
ncbi:hypothetical protein J3E68DRAFT_410051 [Trichoderma sp. SZMC 28012]